MARFALESDSVPTVNPAGAPDVRQRIDASPDAFGGSIGSALGNLGRGVEKVADAGFNFATEQAKIEAQTHASELHTWTSDQVTDEQSKYLSLKGRAALDALPEFKTRIDDITKQAREQAGNPATARMVDSENRKLRDTAYFGAARHAATERKTWETRTAENASVDFGNRAVFQATQSPVPNVGDDPIVSRNLFNSDQEIRNLAEGHGYEGPAIAAEVAKNRGKNVENIVKELTRDESPTGLDRAIKFYKEQENSIDAGIATRIKGFLMGPSARVDGERIGKEELRLPPSQVLPETVAGVSPNFIGAIKTSEGFTAQAKWDYKQHTNGFGTKAEYPGEVIDTATANKRFNKAIEQAAAIVDRVNPNLDPGSRAAMITLTFNAGNAWENAGLGAAIRAGDIPKAKELFLQYNRAGGEVNEGLVQRRAREASWFGRDDISLAQAGSPHENKGVVMERILRNPNIKPIVRDAALAFVNKYYTAWDLQSATDSAAFKLKLQNSTAEALDTGQVKQPLSREEFITGLGAAEGEQKYIEYQKNVQLGADMRATAGMSPGDLASLREKYKPVPGDTYVVQQERAAMVDKAISVNEKAKAKDPVDYLIRRTEFGSEAYRQFQTLMADPKATSEMRTAYASMYAEKMLAEQARLGVLADQRRVVPAAFTDALNAQLENPQLAGGASGVAQAIEAQAKLWGPHWPNVYRQLSEKASPVVRVVGSGVQSAAAQALVDLAPLSLSAILKDQDTEKNSQIKKDVLDAFKPLAASMAGNDGATSLFNDFRGQAEKLAAKYVIGGMTSTEAATKAYEQLVGFKYTFQDGYRVPKDAGVDASTIAKGTVIALRDLGKPGLEVMPAVDNMGGLSPEYLGSATIKGLQRDGKWVTSPDERGLALVHNDQAQRRPDGQPLVLTWKELAAMGERVKVQDKINRDALFDARAPFGVSN